MHKKKITLLYFRIVVTMIGIFFLIPQKSFAQLSDFQRVDFPIDGNKDVEFNVIEYGQKGLMVFTIQSTNYGRDQSFVFTKMDTDLKRTWGNQYTAPSGFKLAKYFKNDDYFFCLLKKDDKNDILILRIDAVRGDYIVSECKLLTRMNIEVFTVLKSKAIIGGDYNERPVIELINLFDQTSKVLPEIHSNNFDINSIEVNPEAGDIYVILKNNKNCKLNLNVYNYDGKVISTLILGEKKKLPVNGKILKSPDGDYLIAGNYSDNCSDYSVGFYTQSLSKNEKTKYYDFVELRNFLSYLPEKRQNRMKKRISTKRNRGKDVKLRHRLLLHDPVSTTKGITLVAEVFYPEFKNTNTPFVPINRNYQWVSSNYNSYNNFRYTHALICTFNDQGKLIWDNSISLNEIQSRTLDKKVQFSETNNKFIIAYPDDGLIKTTIINRLDEVTSTENVDLKSGTDKLRIVENQESELVSWYDHVFIAYGIQSIKEAGSVMSKDVFYLSKLTYQ